MHPLKLVKIKNPFGILQTNPQIPREWVGNFDFQKNMFGWDTLMYNSICPQQSYETGLKPTMRIAESALIFQEIGGGMCISGSSF